MDVEAIVRALHVIGVVLWIGGVGFVTTVLLPAVARTGDAADRIQRFEAAEHRFAGQAKGTTLLVGATGFYLTRAYDAWDRFLDPAYWWMHGMVIIWAIFTVILFIAEPLFLHRWFAERAKRDPEGTFAIVQRLHWVLLCLSLIVVFGAVAGTHA